MKIARAIVIRLASIMNQDWPELRAALLSIEKELKVEPYETNYSDSTHSSNIAFSAALSN